MVFLIQCLCALGLCVLNAVMPFETPTGGCKEVASGSMGFVGVRFFPLQVFQAQAASVELQLGAGDARRMQFGRGCVRRREIMKLTLQVRPLLHADECVSSVRHAVVRSFISTSCRSCARRSSARASSSRANVALLAMSDCRYASWVDIRPRVGASDVALTKSGVGGDSV